MQTAKANSKSKQSGKTAVRTPAVSEAVAAQAQDPVAAGSPDMKPAEPQATDIGAVNPVAETSPAEQPAAHPETDVRLLDLNKIVNSTYNPRKNFREDTLLELAESIRQWAYCNLSACVRGTRASRSSTASVATGLPPWRI